MGPSCSLQASTTRRGRPGATLQQPDFSGHTPMPNAHAVAVVPVPDFQKLEMLVLNSVRSPQSKRAYKRALEDFLAWYRAGGYPALAKAVVQRYRAELEQSGLAPSTVNLKLTAIRRLAAEAADNGLLDGHLAAGIARVKGTKSRGVRTGHWLSRAQAEEL